MAVMDRKNMHLAVAFLLGAFFGPMLLGLVTGAVGRFGGKVPRNGG